MPQTQETKNQHYVPQGYLKNFTYDEQRLLVFDKFTGRWNSRSKKSVASASNFHDVHPDILQEFYEHIALHGYPAEDTAIIERIFADPQFIEHELSGIETAFYDARDSLLNAIDRSAVISTGQKEAFAYFMTIQHLRTPEVRRAIIELQEQLANKLVEDEGLYVVYDQRYASLHHAGVLFNPEIQQAYVNILSRHIWTVGMNQTGEPLYTSDTPIVMAGHATRYREIGVGVPGIEIAFPLSPHHILVLWERNLFRDQASEDGTAWSLSLAEVRHYNRLQVLRSYQQVYSQSCDFGLAKEVCQCFPNVCDPNRTHGTVRWLRKNTTGSSILHFRQPNPDRVQFEVH